MSSGSPRPDSEAGSSRSRSRLGVVLAVAAVLLLLGWLLWVLLRPPAAVVVEERKPAPSAETSAAAAHRPGEPELSVMRLNAPVVTVEADGTLKVNGVAPVARAGGLPPLGLERAVQVREWADENGNQHVLWAQWELGIAVETVRALGQDTPRLLALEMGARGARTVPELRFVGVLSVLGREVDFSRPQAHGAAALEALRQPEMSQWQWARGRLLLDFAVGETKVSLMLSGASDAVAGALLVPGGE